MLGRTELIFKIDSAIIVYTIQQLYMEKYYADQGVRKKLPDSRVKKIFRAHIANSMTSEKQLGYSVQSYSIF